MDKTAVSNTVACATPACAPSPGAGRALFAACAAAILAACAGGGAKDERDAPLASYSLGAEGASASTVNRYLWAASLETIDFLPVFSADPIAGLVITDWYANPESPQERFKVSVYILDSALRADALRVSVFRQLQSPDGPWIDATVNPATAREIENAILTRARELRLNQIDG
ncbi:MAG: DUF3576 domain-containing protein [Parvularculaceae bacterium]